MRVTIYTKPDCHLCEDALVILDRLTPQYGLEVHEVNILDDMALYDAYHLKIPVIAIEDGRLGTLEAPIDEAGLRVAFETARRASVETFQRSNVPTFQRPSRIDRLALYIGRHWLLFASLTFGIFATLPWLTAVFAWLGWWTLADPLYTAYAFTCHQLPERAGSVFGYQVGFCYRNTALYGGAALFGAMYGLARSGKVGWLAWMNRPAPWWVFVLFLLPMVIDGITHMLGLREMMDMSMNMGLGMGADLNVEPMFGSFFVGSQLFSFNWWLRVITGLLAALGFVWFAYPRMNRSVVSNDSLRVMQQQSTQMQSNPTAAQ